MHLKLKHLGPAYFYRQALEIALPVMLQQLIMSMVSLIDNFMVAGLGDISMAAVNVANQINFTSMVIINAVCSAGGIYLAQFSGAQDAQGMKQAFRFKVIFTLLVSLIYFTLCWVIPAPMISLMTRGNAAQMEIVAIGARYIRLTSFTLFPLAISSAIGTSFREIGLPKIPLVISAIATLVNTLGNWILIYGNLGAPRLEVFGAAVATIIARYVELTLFLLYIAKKKSSFSIRLGSLFHVDRKLIKTILAKSAMVFLSELSWISSETIMTALYNGRGGAETVAGMAAGWTIANLFFLIFNGIWTVSAVLVGGTLGAGKLEEARKRAAWLKSGAVIAGGVLMVLGFAASAVLIPLVFSNLTSQARSISLGLVTVVLIYLPLWCLLNALFAISRSGGDAAMGAWTDVSVNTLIFVPGAFLLAFLTTMSPVKMFAILKLSDFVKVAVARHFYRKERWVRNLTNVEKV
ncbi:MAG: MATE family efflux transporter [Treponema sp.]|jgi:putative MATE family efflux protein|nr:MATE family efflux transporter [Treponema sp.]